MFFTYETNQNLTKQMVRGTAKLKLALYKLTTNDLVLDRYLQSEYNLGLYDACIKLINDIKIAKAENNRWVVTFNKNESNKFAELITFGTGRILGSRILIRILSQIIRKGR